MVRGVCVLATTHVFLLEEVLLGEEIPSSSEQHLIDSLFLFSIRSLGIFKPLQRRNSVRFWQRISEKDRVLLLVLASDLLSVHHFVLFSARVTAGSRQDSIQLWAGRRLQVHLPALTVLLVLRQSDRLSMATVPPERIAKTLPPLSNTGRPIPLLRVLKKLLSIPQSLRSHSLSLTQQLLLQCPIVLLLQIRIVD